MNQNEKTRRRAYLITRERFQELLTKLLVPIRFIEVLANNNGCFQTRITYTDKGETESLRG